jgi:hypothetical protein
MATGVLTAVGAAARRAAGADAEAVTGAAVRASAAATTPVVATTVQRWRYDDIGVPSRRDSFVPEVDQYSTSADIPADAERIGPEKGRVMPAGERGP